MIGSGILTRDPRNILKHLFILFIYLYFPILSYMNIIINYLHSTAFDYNYGFLRTSYTTFVENEGMGKLGKSLIKFNSS